MKHGYLSPGPRSAVERIKDKFGQIPDRLGSNCSGLNNLRNVINTCQTNFDFNVSNALVISAVHTHWEDSPIIYQYVDELQAYRVGPALNLSPKYLACGFIFSKRGPIAYEWADDSCRIDTKEAEKVWTLIEEINELVVLSQDISFPSPYGLSLNFRFKSLLAPAKNSTHETPGEKPDIHSYIRKSQLSHRSDQTYMDQVGWSASIPPKLNSLEIKLLEDLENFMISKT